MPDTRDLWRRHIFFVQCLQRNFDYISKIQITLNQNFNNNASCPSEKISLHFALVVCRTILDAPRKRRPLFALAKKWDRFSLVQGRRTFFNLGGQVGISLPSFQLTTGKRKLFGININVDIYCFPTQI